MKKLIVLFVLLLLVLGGAGGGYYFFVMKKDTPPEQMTKEEEQKAEPFFSSVDTITIPVIRSGAVKKYVSLQISLETYDKDRLEIINAQQPRIEDAFLRSLHGYFAETPINAPLNVRDVKVRLMKDCARLLGPDMVKDVLIQGAYERIVR